MADPVMRIEGVSKRFGGIQAAVGVELRRAAPGEILGVIGPNGAGKSVMINVASGIYAADEGRIVHRERDITHLNAHQRGRAGIARTFQNIRLFKRMTVLENVLVADKTHAIRPFGSLLSFGRRGAEIAAGLVELDRMRLADKADQLAGTLAYGDARRLEIARALAGNPSVLFLDEPAAGMNERETEKLLTDIRACRSRLDAIIVVEHDMALLRRAVRPPGRDELRPAHRRGHAGHRARPSGSGERLSRDTRCLTLPVLEVRGIKVGYGPIKAIRDCSLEVAAGETVAVVGANGAGKTTLLRAISPHAAAGGRRDPGSPASRSPAGARYHAGTRRAAARAGGQGRHAQPHGMGEHSHLAGRFGRPRRHSRRRWSRCSRASSTPASHGVDDVNAKGGVNGSKIEIKLEDDQLNAQQSVLLFRKLVSDGVFVVLARFPAPRGRTWPRSPTA